MLKRPGSKTQPWAPTLLLFAMRPPARNVESTLHSTREPRITRTASLRKYVTVLRKVKDTVFSDSQALRRSRAPPGEATPYAALEPERVFGTTGFLDAA